MRVRNGFVSNSSSTSYIVSIANETKCDKCKCGNEIIIKHIAKLFESDRWAKDGMFSGDIKSNLKSLGAKVAGYKKDIKFGEKQLLALSFAINNKDAVTLAGFILHNIRYGSGTISLCEKLTSNRYTASGWDGKTGEIVEQYTENIKREISDIQRAINDDKEEIKKMQDKIRILKSLKDAELYAFDLSYGSKEKELMDYFIDNNLVNVVERKDT